MKRILLSTLLGIAVFTAKAQTKGTNAIGLGFSTSQSESSDQSGTYETKEVFTNLSYGQFFKDNFKWSLNGNYSRSKEEYAGGEPRTTDGYGGGAALQKYFPLIGKLYAFSGANTGYMYSKDDYPGTANGLAYSSSLYSFGASGGVAVFLKKHFLFEATLLRASGYYQVRKQTNNSTASISRQTNKNFGLSTSGSLTNLGFQIYFLF